MLVLLCLMVSIGVTWARYRTEMDKSVYFQVRKPVAFYLGRIEYAEDETQKDAEGKFVRSDEGEWERDEDGNLKLKFAVANGTSQTDYEKRDQQVSIRFIGSLGVQSGEAPITLTLTFPSEEDPEKPCQVKATAVRIDPESPMYTTYGDGWVFSFQENGEELTWMLEGGELTYVEMDVTMDAEVIDTSLLQLQVVTRYVSD